MAQADPAKVSMRAKKRGLPQVQRRHEISFSILESKDCSQFDKCDYLIMIGTIYVILMEIKLLGTMINNDNYLILVSVHTTARYSGCWQPLCRDPGCGWNIRQVGGQQDGNRGERPSLCHDSLGLQGIWPSSSYRLLYILFEDFGIFMSIVLRKGVLLLCDFELFSNILYICVVLTVWLV